MKEVRFKGGMEVSLWEDGRKIGGRHGGIYYKQDREIPREGGRLEGGGGRCLRGKRRENL